MAEPGKHANQIFISYRRDDSAAITGRIYDRLLQKFGRDVIFKDVDSIPLGVNFRKHLDSIISECAVVLVVIGDRWVGIRDETGRARLDDPRDFVRIEIESALRREIPVVPLLVQNAQLPDEESLPESLRELADRNGMSIGHDPHFHVDINRLIANLETILARAKDETRPGPAEDSERPAARPHAPAAARPPTSVPQAARATPEPVVETEQEVRPQAAEEKPAPAVESPTPTPLAESHASAHVESRASAASVQWYARPVALVAGALITVAAGLLAGAAAESAIGVLMGGGISYDDFNFVFGLMGAGFAAALLGSIFVYGWPALGWRWGLWLSAPLVYTALVVAVVWVNSATRLIGYRDMQVIIAALAAVPFILVSACLGAQVDLFNTFRASKLLGRASLLGGKGERVLAFGVAALLLVFALSLASRLAAGRPDNTNNANTNAAETTATPDDTNLNSNSVNANSSNRPPRANTNNRNS